jgi:hypothetical protein
VIEGVNYQTLKLGSMYLTLFITYTLYSTLTVDITNISLDKLQYVTSLNSRISNHAAKLNTVLFVQ